MRGMGGRGDERDGMRRAGGGAEGRKVGYPLWQYWNINFGTVAVVLIDMLL